MLVHDRGNTRAVLAVTTAKDLAHATPMGVLERMVAARRAISDVLATRSRYLFSVMEIGMRWR